MIVVGTIVGNVQLTIAIDEGQVTIAIQTAGMTCTNSYQVTIISIMDRGGSISIYCCGVGIQRTTTRSNVTTGKDGIVDDDTVRIKIIPVESTCRLVLQQVQV